MATSPDHLPPPPPDPPKVGADASMNAALDAAQDQLRDVLEQATLAARQEVDALSKAVTAREAEISTLEASLTAERTTLDAERSVVADRLATANERQRVADAQMDEAKELNACATKSLADALDRSAQVVEQAEARVREDEARSRAKIEAELKDARSQAAEIQTRASKRLEAVRVESEATLQRAVERAMGIVSAAEGSAEQSKAALRQLVDRIEEYLRREPVSEVDYTVDFAIDLRADDEPPEGEVELDVVEPEQTNVTPFLARVDSAEETLTEPEPVSEEVAADHAMDGYFGEESASDEDGDEADSTEQRVASAVRRAVKGWSTARQEAN